MAYHEISAPIGGPLAARLVARVQAVADERDVDLDLSLSGKPCALPADVERAIEEAAHEMLQAANVSAEMHHIRLVVDYRDSELFVSLDHDGTLEPPTRARTEAAVLDAYSLLGGVGGGVSFSTGRGFGSRVELTVPYNRGNRGATDTLPARSSLLPASPVVPRVPPEQPVEHLTPQEDACLALLAAGYSNKEIATQLHISLGTVKFHLAQIYQKLGVQGRGRGAAVARARELGLIFD